MKIISLVTVFTLCLSLAGFDKTDLSEFNKTVKPFLAKYCYNCHDEDVQKGKFAIHDILSLNWRSLSWKTKLNRKIFLRRKLVENIVFDIAWFSCSSWPTEENRHLIFNIDFKKMRISYWDISFHNNLLRN